MLGSDKSVGVSTIAAFWILQLQRPFDPWSLLLGHRSLTCWPPLLIMGNSAPWILLKEAMISAQVSRKDCCHRQVWKRTSWPIFSIPLTFQYMLCPWCCLPHLWPMSWMSSCVVISTKEHVNWLSTSSIIKSTKAPGRSHYFIAIQNVSLFHCDTK